MGPLQLCSSLCLLQRNRADNHSKPQYEQKRFIHDAIFRNFQTFRYTYAIFILAALEQAASLGSRMFIIFPYTTLFSAVYCQDLNKLCRILHNENKMKESVKKDVLCRCILPIFITVLITVVSIISLAQFIEAQHDHEITIPGGENAVEIDGLWSTNEEWMDASEAKITNEELTAYLKAKHDEAYLYVMIDFVSDQGLEASGDFAVICFDTKRDGGNVPLLDDYCFYRITRTGDFMDGIIQGNGVRWTVLQEAETWDPYDEKFDAAVAYSHKNDPYDSINNHVIYEFRIPMDSYGFNEEMGFYVYVHDAYTKKFVEWPTNAGGKQFKLIVKDILPAPDKWGDLSLKLDKKESDISEPQIQLEEKEEKVEVKVQAKQIKDLVIVRLRNLDESTQDIYGFKILLPDSLLNAFKGPKEWVKEDSNDKEAMFSTLNKPIRAGDNGYFLLKVNGVKPNLKWTVYGLDNREVGEGSVIPFLR